MNEMRQTSEQKETPDETLGKLPFVVREYIPDQNLDYYKKTNEMHCNLDQPGGSKFTEIPNIFKVLEKDGVRITDMAKERKDDRDLLLKAGADGRSFLPATKQEGAPERDAEALYYKVDGIKGKLGVEQLGNLPPDTKVLIRREKSVKDENGKERVPCSFTVVKGTFDELPDTDFATVIIGREGGRKDELWTIHPGMPIRPAGGDFIEGSESLPGPEEGKKQEVIAISIGELLSSGKMKNEDYIKIVPGDFEKEIEKYEVRDR